MTGLPLPGSGKEASQASSFCFGRTLAMPLTSSKAILHPKSCLEAGRATAQLIMALVSKTSLHDLPGPTRDLAGCSGLGTEEDIFGDTMTKE